MKRGLNQKKETNMKTTKVLLFGAVVTAFAFTTFGGDVQLSPRAKDSQIKVAPGITAAQPAQAGAVALAPRAQVNQIKTVSGVVTERNPYLECRNSMTGSPKAVQACADNPNMPACKPVTVAPLK